MHSRTKFTILFLAAFMYSFALNASDINQTPNIVANDNNIIRKLILPNGKTNPTCLQDPCLCGWCPEKPEFGQFGDPNLTTILPNMKDQLFLEFPKFGNGPREATNPTCAEDPCLCGWCLKKEVGGTIEKPSLMYSPTKKNIPKIDASAHSLGRKLVDRGSYCPDQNRRPWQVSRESFLTRTAMNTCSVAANNLKEFQDKVRKVKETQLGLKLKSSAPLIWPSDIAKGLLDYDPILKRTSKVAFFGYANHCLKKLPDVIDPSANRSTQQSNFLTLASAPGSVTVLTSSIGILRANDSGETCSASLVKLNNSTYLIAAMHCLGKEKISKYGRAKFTKIWSSMSFVSFSGRMIVMEIDQKLAELEYDTFRHDLFALELEGLVEEPALSVAVLPIKPWEPMLIVGHNVYLEALAADQGMSGARLRTNSIAIQSGADCTARTSERGFLRYLCQTEKGTSGAPILIWREGRYVLAGIHLGAVPGERKRLNCISGIGAGGVNRGISIRWP